MVDITSNIAGTVWKIAAKVGDVVALNDEIMILESMKMEIPVEAAADGTVAELLVKEGEAVAAGQVLGRIRPG